MFGDYFDFGKVLGPRLLSILYWIGAVAILLGVLRGVFSGAQMLAEGSGFGALRIISSLLVGAVVAIVLRVLCELARTVFEMNEKLARIAARAESNML
jgi:hypothetical protein